MAENEINFAELRNILAQAAETPPVTFNWGPAIAVEEQQAAEAEGRLLMELPLSDRKRAARFFRRAVEARIKQWDCEREIEAILGREVELDIGEWAAVGPDVDVEDLARQLGEIE